jgi:hypothetical protein
MTEDHFFCPVTEVQVEDVILDNETGGKTERYSKFIHERRSADKVV